MSPSAIELGDGPQCCDWCGAAFRNFRFAQRHEESCQERHRDDQTIFLPEALTPEVGSRILAESVRRSATGGEWRDVKRHLRARGGRPFFDEADEKRLLG